MLCRSLYALGITALFFAGATADSFAQGFGVETHNTLMPASGGMGGASLTRPQDVTSAINGNPATLSQFHGTEFTFSGAWVEPTYNLAHTGGVLPNVGAFAAKSEAQGSAAGNIGVTQDLRSVGLPGTFGIGFITAAGGASDFRQVPASNGTNTDLFVYEMTAGVGLDLTEQLAAGAGLSLGTAMFDGPFVGVGGMSYDYALRGTVGLNYALNPCASVGVYYQTPQSFSFDNAIQLDLGPNRSPSFDVDMDLPDNIGIGIASQQFLDGRLLLAVDVLYKQWENADLFRALYRNQWVVQTGAQYSYGKLRMRAGYVWAENPIDPDVGLNLGGVTPPAGPAAINYAQGLLAITGEHRITLGAGLIDVLPGVDLDLMAGGMFENDQQLGAFTAASMESYWIGTGLTWHFGACGHAGHVSR